jgi:AraC-like DNA-binding protein
MERREVFDFCLVYFFAANGSCWVNGVDYPFNPRTLLIEPPFKPSHFEMDPSMPTRHIAVHFDICDGFPDKKPVYLRKPYEVTLSSDLQIPTSTIFPDKFPLAQTLFQLVEEWQRNDTIGALQANAILSQILLAACRFAQASEKSESRARVRKSALAAARYIEEHFAEAINSKKIAEAVGYSTNYLNRIFREQIGVSLMDYLTNMRMGRATELLEDPRHSVKDISRMVGCQSCRYFSRTFQDHYGTTPTQWRQSKSPSVKKQ